MDCLKLQCQVFPPTTLLVSRVFYPIHNLSDSESSSNPYLNISSANLGPNVRPTTVLYVIFGIPIHLLKPQTSSVERIFQQNNLIEGQKN